MVELGRLLEHILPEGALEQPCGGNGADMVEALGVKCLSCFNRMPGAFDIGLALALGVGTHVVNGGEMKEVIDVALKFADIGIRQAKARLRQIADNGNHPGFIHAPALAQFGELVQGLFPDQQVDDATAGQQFFYEEAADKSGSACQKIVHSLPILLLLLLRCR